MFISTKNLEECVLNEISEFTLHNRLFRPDGMAQPEEVREVERLYGGDRRTKGACHTCGVPTEGNTCIECLGVLQSRAALGLPLFGGA
jgi:hypothetical protein